MDVLKQALAGALQNLLGIADDLMEQHQQLFQLFDREGSLRIDSLTFQHGF